MIFINIYERRRQSCREEGEEDMAEEGGRGVE